MRPHPCLGYRPATRCLLAALAACLLLAPAAGQAQATSATSPNVYAAGGEVRAAAPVRGDFTAVGGKVVLDQSVGGDASLAGGSVVVRAPVGDDVRAAGGDVSIESKVGGELFATGGNIDLGAAAVVGRGATLYGSNVNVEGRIEGPLNATAQKVTINGEVTGDTRLVAEQIELGPRARLQGSLSYSSANALKQADGASISGTVQRQDEMAMPAGRPGREPWQRSMQAPFWVGGALTFLALLACGAVLLLLLPDLAEAAAQRVGRNPVVAAAIGLLAVCALPVLAVLLFITLLGIPLGLAVLALYPVLLLAGFLVGVVFLARMGATRLQARAPASLAAGIGYFALALAVVLLVAKVPFVGGLALAVLGLVGLGATAMELAQRFKARGRRDGGASPTAFAAGHAA